MNSYYSDKNHNFVTDTIEEMTSIVQAMNTIVIHLNDENAYYYDWIDLVPDQATKDELKDIAEDPNLLEETIQRFKMIIKKYITK